MGSLRSRVAKATFTQEDGYQSTKLGVFNLIVCVIGAIISLLFFLGADYLAEAILAEGGQDGIDDDTMTLVLYVTFGIVFAVCVFYIFIASLLIHGARTSRPGFLMPWIVLTIISLVLEALKVIQAIFA